MAKDPVCGMYVEENENAIKSVRNGKTYYFCSENCKEQFEKPDKEYKKLKFLLIFSWSLTVPVVFLTYFSNIIFLKYVIFTLATIIQFYPGFRFYKGLLNSIKNRTGNMDTLIAMGTTVAWLYSTTVTFFPSFFIVRGIYFDTSSLIISLVLTGTFMENLMKQKATNALHKLISLQPKIAHLIKDGGLIDIDADKIKKNYILLVKPGERFPTDSEILEGVTEVDESMITGESLPVLKRVGDTVIGGTLNIINPVKIKVSKTSEENTLSEIISIVEKATTERVPIQRLADKVSSYFVPLVILTGIFSFFFWYFIGDIGLTYSLLVLVSVLIIACPCALGIATPAALMVSSGKAAVNGIIFKNGESIENASKINTVILDKTGTLTVGKPEITDIYTFNDFSKKDVLKLAAIAEIQSEHLFGKAIINEVRGERIEFPESFQYIPGMGVKAIYNKNTIIVGNLNMMRNEGIDFNYQDLINDIEVKGKAVLIVAYNSKVIGIFGISDKIKDESKKTIEEIKKMGIDIWMITGDNEYSAKEISENLEIENVISNAKPKDKLEKIKELKKMRKTVAMVGDGINDAPALAEADLGIALGTGSDIAAETGGVILMKGDIYDVVKVLKLGRKTLRKIKQNLAWAFLYNLILIPVAAGLLIPFYGPKIYNILPIFAAIAMAFSSTTVVSNSILLNREKL
ncbi:MAG: heavy metal translocating P-type ATPase [Thermoplasmata archaeon]